MLPERKQISKSNKKNRCYKYRKGSTIVLFFPRLTEYTDYLNKVLTSPTHKQTLESASNLVVWIAKQNRFSIIKGHLTEHQINQIEQDVSDLYDRYTTNKWLNQYKPFNVLDESHIPPEHEYITDLI